MNTISEMLPICRSCPYWEIAEEPYICKCCLKKAKEIFADSEEKPNE